MFFSKSFLRGIIVMLLIGTPAARAFADEASGPLGMPEAVHIAVTHDSALQQLVAAKAVTVANATAAGTLPDPKLTMGLSNLPTDTFAVGQQPMTMQVIGIQQAFPAGDSRALAQQRGDQMADSQQAAIDARRLQVARAVRLAWLNAYFAEHAIELTRANEAALEQSVAIAKEQYQNGKGTQQQWLRARLALADPKVREIEFVDAQRSAQAALVRWLGEDASRALTGTVFDLPSPPTYRVLLDRLPMHPVLRQADAKISADQTGVELARQSYKPSWGLSLSYGRRPGDDAAGRPYSNMVTALVTFSLPLFTGDRQDQQTVSARETLKASTYARDDQLRQLKQELDDDWARWQDLKQLNALYAQTVLPDSAADVTSGLDAYGNGSGDFFEVIRAQLGDLNAKLRALRIQVDTEALKAQFLYLTGEQG